MEPQDPSQSGRFGTVDPEPTEGFTERGRPDPGLAADVAGVTDIGQRRRANEDHFLVATLERSIVLESTSLRSREGLRITDVPQGRILVVADGMGGHEGGEVASSVAVDSMAHYAFSAMPWVLASEPSLEELSDGLREAMRAAQRRIQRVAVRRGIDPHLGTTLTMAYLVWPRLHVVHVGDSRAYLYRDGRLHRITRDHTYAQQLVDHYGVSEDEAARLPIAHVLSNVLGGAGQELEIDLHHALLVAGDVVLLCTDGLTGPVGEAQIAAVLASGEPAMAMAGRLIELANQAGGPDNVTAIVARIPAAEAG